MHVCFFSVKAFGPLVFVNRARWILNQEGVEEPMARNGGVVGPCFLLKSTVSATYTEADYVQESLWKFLKPFQLRTRPFHLRNPLLIFNPLQSTMLEIIAKFISRIKASKSRNLAAGKMVVSSSDSPRKVFVKMAKLAVAALQATIITSLFL